MNRTSTLVAALAALAVPGLLAAQDQPQQGASPASAAPATPGATSASAASQQAVPEIKKDASAVIKDEKKTESAELKLLSDQESAELAALSAKNPPPADQADQAAKIREKYARLRADVQRKYHAEKSATLKEEKHDLKKDQGAAKP